MNIYITLLLFLTNISLCWGLTGPALYANTNTAAIHIKSVNVPQYLLVGKHSMQVQIQNTSSNALTAFDVYWYVPEQQKGYYMPVLNVCIEPMAFYNINLPNIKVEKGIQELQIWIDNINASDEPTAVLPASSVFSHKMSGAEVLYEQNGLVEHFTASNCSVCATKNPDFFATLATYGDAIATISYQAYWWEGEIFFQNPSDYQDRVEYYFGPEMADFSNITGTPSIAIQGVETLIVPSPGNGVAVENLHSRLDAVTDLTSPFAINLSESINLDETTTTITFNFDVTVEPTTDIIAENLHLYVILIEEEVTYDVAPGVNGETTFEFLMRDVLINQPLTSTTANVPTMASATYTVPSYVNPFNLRTIVLVQDDFSPESVGNGNFLTHNVHQVFLAPLLTGANVNATPNIINTLCPTCVTVKSRALLGGAFDVTTNQMLNNNAVVPQNQPFNTAPWNYNGTEFVENMPDNVVDWVLLEARSAINNDIVVARRAALILNNGIIVELDGSPEVLFSNLSVNGDYYLVLRHRNHLDVMSSTSISLPNATGFDFRQAENVFDGNNQMFALPNGLHALSPGDFDGDGILVVADFNLYTSQIATINQYIAGDCTLDGNVTVVDLNAYIPNASKIGVPQIRY